MRPIPLPSSIPEYLPDLGRLLLAVNKPPSLSSAQVVRDLQNQFKNSARFAPLVQQALDLRNAEAQQPKRRKTNSGSRNLIKMGHGGTLDPMATGILIIGVGGGTRRLPDFLLSKKTYVTTVLFGKGSDTYDIVGKNIAESPYQHITRELVEKHLEQFRGKIKQVPPIYSALKINGMKAYEYARSGQELPRELETRDMEVTECKLLEFYEGGHHDFRWPANEADAEEKEVARKFLGEAEASPISKDCVDSNEGTRQSDEQNAKDLNGAAPSALSVPAPTIQKNQYDNQLSPEAKAALHTHEIPILSSTPCPAPAARFRLTVSSGFYVRSFAHDLGRAVGSLGMMASLVRSNQAGFSCTADEPNTTQALTYGELESGEEVWGPRVQSMLEEWTRKHPPVPVEQEKEQVRQRQREGLRGFTPRKKGDGYYDRDRRDDRRDASSRGQDRQHDHDSTNKRRRNSSSPE